MATAGSVKEGLNRHEKHIWELVALSPAKNLWDLREVPLRVVVRRTVRATIHDRLPSIAAELGFWFAFALFPALICATTILGLAARSAAQVYSHLITHMALVVPASALDVVMQIFRQTTTSSTPGKLTFGLLATIWSASVGISAVQGATNAVYKLEDRRSYLKARLEAILLTLLLLSLGTLALASMFAGDFVSGWFHHHMHGGRIVVGASVMVVRICGWVLAIVVTTLSFSLVYYWAPDLRSRQWHWVTPGAGLGVAGWFVASIGFRIDLHYFNSYSVTYGSIGAFIILLMWFYITGLMLLLGAEFNSELEAASAELRLQKHKADESHEPGDPRPLPTAA